MTDTASESLYCWLAPPLAPAGRTLDAGGANLRSRASARDEVDPRDRRSSYRVASGRDLDVIDGEVAEPESRRRARAGGVGIVRTAHGRQLGVSPCRVVVGREAQVPFAVARLIELVLDLAHDAHW